MASTKQKLGWFIERVEQRNSDLQYGIDDVRGVTLSKEITPTKADVSGRSFSRFQIVKPRDFILNRRTHGVKIGLGYNNSDQTFIVTEDYVVFHSANEAVLMPEYLAMFVKRPEFDRYANFDAWGSATVFFNWEELCDVPIAIPPLHIQQKYVDVYNAMLANQRAYERGLEDLNAAISASVEGFKHTAPRVTVGTLLEEIDMRNRDGAIKNVQGINITKNFMPSVANLSSSDLTKYKVVKKNQFAYSPMQTGRDGCIRIALFHEDEPVIISPAYSVLQVKSEAVLAEYIMLWFSRSESDRYGWFISDSSVRASLELSRFYEMQLPLPSIDVQQYIVNIYTAYQLRREINEQLKAQIKDLCPILIKGALDESVNA